MENTAEGASRWQPLQWFLDGWHNAFDEQAVGDDPEGARVLELVLGSNALQPGWIVELEHVNETSFPEVLYEITSALSIRIDVWLREGRDLDSCGSFLRGCAAYGIVTERYFHGRSTLPGYRDFIERIRNQLCEAGATLAALELSNTIDPRSLKDQLIVMTPNGIEQRQELSDGQDALAFISTLDFPSPHSLLLELSASRQLGYIRAHDGSILSYPISFGNFFALGCSSTGRFNPFGLGAEELWRSQRYFPLIGSLAEPTGEIENGLSWWRITNPQISPLQTWLPDSAH